MSKRKPNNTRARVERASRALLSTNYVGVINIDPHGGQFLVHLKTGKPIRHGVALANAVCDIAHRWVIYFSAFCIDQNGLHYIKSIEIATPGIHLAGQLTEVIEEHYRALMDTCNRRHIVGSAWIANPCGVSLSEEQAAHIYDCAGAWAHVERTQAAQGIPMSPYKITGPAQIGFSGGRSSGYMLYHILEAHGGQLPEGVHVTFQNTGKERPETLDFIHECQRHWNVPITWLEFDGVYGHGLSWKVVSYETASRDGEPFAAMLAYYANLRREEKGEPPILPNPVNRMCTDRMKIKASTWYMRDVLGLDHWDAIIGIRADEPRRYHRMMAANEKGGNRWENVTPMFQAGVLKADVNSFWARQLFDLGIDSDLGNCDLCFLKSPDKILRAIVESPESARWWIEAEERTGQVFRRDRPNYKAMAWMAEQIGRQMPLDFDFSEQEDLADCMCGD